MIIECNQCHERFGQCRANHGAGIMLASALLTGILCAWLTRFIGGWVFLLALPMWLLAGWLLWEIPRWWTMLCYRSRRCPKCGACDWGRPR